MYIDYRSTHGLSPLFSSFSYQPDIHVSSHPKDHLVFMPFLSLSQFSSSFPHEAWPLLLTIFLKFSSWNVTTFAHHFLKVFSWNVTPCAHNSLKVCVLKCNPFCSTLWSLIYGCILYICVDTLKPEPKINWISWFFYQGTTELKTPGGLI